MTRVAMILAVAVLATASASAQAPLPSVDQIIQRYIAVSGGTEAIKKLHSRVSRGTFEVPELGASGTFESFARAPNSSAVHIDFGGLGMFREGFDGSVGWAEDPNVGLRDKTGAELVAAKLDSQFYKGIMLKDLYREMKVLGMDKVRDRDAYVVEAVAEGVEPEKMYFDVESGHLVRTDVRRETAEGIVPITIYFEDHRAIDGVQMPFKMVQSLTSFSVIIRVQEVSHNVAIDDDKFARP